MQITKMTLSSMRKALSILLLSLALTTLAACERTANATANFDAQSSSMESGSGPGSAPIQAVFTGRVVGVTDGDTLTLLDAQNVQHTIRLAEIDAPERGQPWGNRSKETLSALVFGKTVTVRQTDTDRYERVVGRVFAEGVDVNLAMIERGPAWAYRQYLTDDTLIGVEARARDARVGLWSMSAVQTVAPWEWRRGVRVGEGEGASTGARPQGLLSQTPAVVDPALGAAFTCAGKRVCREMSSCAEAHFYLRQCGVGSLDGNGDGEPCEVLCGTAQR